ncbi:unnamed protein product [Durusdinium trenchii]|uniref:Fe2OG dioxygenase domain-containing protein n=2 Tax=Durusdinium trenchii TaxID=1381693 RepID=A0ABP0RBP2_9DINO
MTSLYPPLPAPAAPVLPGPQAAGTQRAQSQAEDQNRQRLLLSCHLQDLLSAGTSEPVRRPLVTEKTHDAREPITPGLVLDARQSTRFAERSVRDPAERKASLRRVAPHLWEATQRTEPPLKEQPLLLLGDFHSAPKDVGAPGTSCRVVLWDESRRCFASHWPGALPPDFCSHSFDALMTHGPWEPLHSKKGQVTRETCWYVRKGCRCDYTYGIARVRAKRKQTQAFRAAMEILLEEVMRRVCPSLPKEAWPNCANLNLYTEAWQSVGWHADDESLFMGKDRDCPILSVSLGARREFWLALRHQGNCMDPQLKSIVEIDLHNGDILSMEGLCQKHCVHFVPCDVRNIESTSHDSVRARINVTWRWIREHKQRCPQHVEGTEQFFFESSGPPRDEQFFVHAWAGQCAMAWKLCDGCDHDAWRGGRNCVKHQNQWLCRLCYEHALSGAPPHQKVPRDRRRPRRPGLAVIEARAAAEEADNMHDKFQFLPQEFNNTGASRPDALQQLNPLSAAFFVPSYPQVVVTPMQIQQMQVLAELSRLADGRPGVSSSMAPAYQALAAGSFGATSSPTKVIHFVLPKPPKSYYPVPAPLQ